MEWNKTQKTSQKEQTKENKLEEKKKKSVARVQISNQASKVILIIDIDKRENKSLAQAMR